MRRSVALAALLLSVAAPAAAQDRNQPEIYDFEDDVVNGTIQSPLGDPIHVRRHAGSRSLIRARAHFIPELTQTVENL